MGGPIDGALIERDPDLEPEATLVADDLARRGVEVRWFLHKHLTRGRVASAPSTLVVGQVSSLRHVLSRFGIVPAVSSYPEPLRPWLGRSVVERTLAELETALAEGGPSMFINPVATKRFTGFVCSLTDLHRVAHLSRATRIHACEVVVMVSEHRVFVLDHEIVGVRWYAGGDAEPSMDVARSAIAAWHGVAPRAYAMDVAVLDDGRTVLVEINDALALGATASQPTSTPIS